MNRKRVMSLLLSACITVSSCVSMSGVTALAVENESSESIETAVMQEEVPEEETPDAEADEVPTQGKTIDEDSAAAPENENERVVEAMDQEENAAEAITEDVEQAEPAESESKEITEDALSITSVDNSLNAAAENPEASVVGSGSCGENATWELSGLNGAYYLSIGGYGAISVERYEYPWESYHDNIVSVEIGDGITEIAPGAFKDFNQITEVVIPDSVTVIEREAFQYCNSLHSVVMSQNIERIDYSAFENCPIGRLELPVSLRSIGSEAVSYSDTVVYYAGTEDAWNTIIKRNWIVCKEIVYGDQEVPWMNATSGSCGENAEWTLTGEGDNLTLTISGSGDMEDYDYDNLPLWANRCDKIRTIVISDDITSIGGYAFRGCRNVTDIDIPDGVTAIKYSAFASCGLTSADIPDHVQTLGPDCFEACRSLENIVIPDSVTEIGHYAFAECDALTSVTIPGSLTYIGDFPFDNSKNISEVIISGEAGDYLIERLRKMFRKTAWWKSLGDMIIFDNKLISYEGSDKTAVVPDDVTEIKNGAFSGNKAVERVVIPSSVAFVSNAFSECTSLKEIELPSGQTEIVSGTFYGCTSLEHIELPVNLKSIGSRAFGNCTSLKEIMIPDGATEIEEYAFVDCSSLKKADIPDTVTAIGDGVFMRCYGLTSINIPAGVETLGNSVFNGCTGLTSIVIPNGVKSIGWDALSECSNLVTVVIPESVSSISSSAFGYDASERSADLVVYGVEGSRAESYCEEYNIEFRYMNELPDIRILTQPEDVKAAAGEKVTFHVEVQGDNPTFLWQWSADGEIWKNCTGVGYNTNTFSFVMKEKFAGRQYRCIVTANGEGITSDAAVLSLKQKDEIITQPQDVEAAAGEIAEFHIEVMGSNPEYQWQMSTNGTTWRNCTGTGYNTETFSFVMKEKFAGRQYRCIVTADSKTMTSEAAVLSLKNPNGITEQPEDAAALAGDTVSFHIGFRGDNPTYQWKVSSNGTMWKNCTGAGYNTDTFSFVMKEKFAGRQYKCVVTCGGVTYTSDIAVLRLDNGMQILTEPADVMVSAGQTASFHIEAAGENLTYQWQWSSNGKIWKNCTGASYNTDTFSFTTKALYDGRYYRCKVTDRTETIYSGSGKLTVTD